MSRESLIYSPLPTPTSIRLAKCNGKDENGLLKISLIVVDLNAVIKQSPYAKENSVSTTERPYFHCLSYTWGNPHAYGEGFEESFNACNAEYSDSGLSDVRCNDEIVRIGKNLHDFLLQAPTRWTYSIRNRPNTDTGRILLHELVGDSSALLHTYVGFGDNVNWQDTTGQTPLHHAARLGKLENALILLKGGASLVIKDAAGRTAEVTALEFGQTEVHQALQEARYNGIENLVRSIPPFMLESQDEYIWIDALCIDQTNVQERASQVAIMSRIYSCASYVIVWLGREDDSTKQALSALDKIYSCASQYASSDLVPYRDYSEVDYKRNMVPYISSEEWKGLAALFLRQWFRRIWIIQEAVFARSILVLCGTQRIQWSKLRRVAAAFAKRAADLGHDPSTMYIPINDVAQGISYTFEHIGFLRELAQNRSVNNGLSLMSTFNLDNLVTMGYPFRATDPLDKVYALLPLATLHYGQNLPMSADYTLSPTQCFARFTVLQIVDSQNLKSLTVLPDSAMKRIPNLPSWVADYSVPAALHLRQEFTPCTVSGISTVSGTNNEGAFQFALSSDWRCLAIQGAFIDVVADVAACRTDENGPKKLELDQSWFDLLKSIRLCTHYQATGESPCEVLWRTLCANEDSDGKCPAPKIYGDMFKRLVSAMVCCEPEIKLRQEESAREQTAVFVGLMASAALMGEPGYSGPKRAGPNEAAMAEYRSALVRITRSIDSPYFDVVRSILSQLQSLYQSGNQDCIPSLDEIASYFASAAEPLRLPNGRTHITPDFAPFVNAHSRVYGGRRLFATESGFLGLGPASVEPGNLISIVPGFGEMMVLRQMHHRILQETDESTIANHESVKQVRDSLFEFVGEAYVHGLRNSPPVQNIRREDLQHVILV